MTHTMKSVIPMITVEDLRNLRIRAGLTQLELAELIDKTQAYIARLESGSINPPLSVVSEIIEVTTGWKHKTCREVMSMDPVSIDARNSVMQAVDRMRAGNFSQLPVVRTGRILGIITVRDIFNNLELDLDEISVEAIMSSSGVPIVDEATSAESIIPFFNEYQAVLVQRQGRLSGIITRTDLPRLGAMRLFGD